MTLKNISKAIKWDRGYCKQKECSLCIDFCPPKTLELKHGQMLEHGKCTRCNLCEMYCPDLAIKVIKKPS